ncbi:hypothetical protein C8J56DRAFT_1064477 [Mycena floridula]|nr:hypothetical protein C8J56DRAFT_1064477 [Mycena floridula]
MVSPDIIFLALSNPAYPDTFWYAPKFMTIAGAMIPPFDPWWNATSTIPNESLPAVMSYCRAFWAVQSPYEQLKLAQLTNDVHSKGRICWKAWINHLLIHKILPQIQFILDGQITTSRKQMTLLAFVLFDDYSFAKENGSQIRPAVKSIAASLIRHNHKKKKPIMLTN